MPPDGTRRRALLHGFVAAAALACTGEILLSPPEPAGAQSATTLDGSTTATFEAFADTIVPGAKRSAGDQSVAGAASGPGAVQAGAMAVFTLPALGIVGLLPATAVLLNGHAVTYAAQHLILLPWDRPAFVGLPFAHRTALVRQLTSPEALDRLLWVAVAFLAGLAFDAAVHEDTAVAVGAGHPGLAWLGFPAPNPDGLWRFAEFSYGRQLARLHPATTASGSPA
jgi:hypothetical protein